MISKHNIVSPVKDAEGEFLIVNPLYGSADLISAEEKERFLQEIDPEGAFAEKVWILDGRTIYNHALDLNKESDAII